MTATLAAFYVRIRASLPLAVFLIFLNTAAAAPGGISRDALLCGLAFWYLVQLTYVYDAVFRGPEDAVNLPGAPAGAGRAWPVLAAAAPAAAYIAWLGFWPMIVVALLVVPAYSDPGLAPRRLKTLPAVKTLVNVLHFWLVGVLVPVLVTYDFSAALLLTLLRSTWPLLLFCFCLTVLLDVRDVEGDREAGVFSIPVLIGPAAAAGLAALLCFAAGAVYNSKGDLFGALLSAALGLFSLAAVRPRGRSFYEWMLAAVNLALASRLLLGRGGG